MQYKIGQDSEYDEGFELINLIVQCRTKTVPEDHKRLHDYYISQAHSYWKEMKEFISSNNVNSLFLFDGNRNYQPGKNYAKCKAILEERNIKRRDIYKVDCLATDKEILCFKSPERYLENHYPIGEIEGDNEEFDYVSHDINYRFATQTYWQQKESHRKINENILEHRFQFVKKYIIENMEFYEEKFQLMLQRINKKFNSEKLVTVFVYRYLFNYIANLCSFDIGNYLLTSFNHKADFGTQYQYQLYPLPNESGHFSFNAWLYSYFKNTDLIGIPCKNSSYEDEVGYPIDFIIHDVSHLYSGHIDETEYDIFKAIYKRTLLIPNKKEKKLPILTLFSIVHEANFYIANEDMVDIIFWTHRFNDLTTSFYEEYLKFSEISRNVKTMVQVYELIGSEKFSRLSHVENFYKDKEKYFNILLAVVHSVNKIKQWYLEISNENTLN